MLEALQQRDRRRVRDRESDHPGRRHRRIGLDIAPSTGAIALHVDDVAEARAELESQGVEFSAETLDSGVCFQAYFRDPDGNALILHHRYAPPDARPTGA